jgi:3-deoxy-D-manno-octulosonic acid kinase
MIVETHRHTRLGFARNLTPAERDRLIDHLRKPASAPADPLQGRAQVDFMNLPSWGKIVVKHYLRGGLIRRVSHRHHLRGSQSRGEAEFRMLQTLREHNFPVPEPLGWAEQGRLWVQTWLFIAEIPQARTLAEISCSEREGAATFLAEVSNLIDRLCDLKIHHVDLHPGNVVVNGNDHVFLIDFDKAAPTTESTNALRDRYHRRWNRAIAKHALSSGLKLPIPA